jgi:hypothetical protein
MSEHTEQRESYAPEVPTKNLPPVPYKDMPEPLPLRKVLGPGVILAGIGVGSGEYILWPYISTQVGLGFLCAVFVGVTIQYFLNMEIERYTLATGETAISGFVRFWKPWGILMVLFALIPNVWPAWATSGAQTLSFLLGTGQGSVSLMSILLLIACGVALTISPVVYQTVEKAEFLKVGLVVLFLITAIVVAISPSAWTDISQVVTEPVLPGHLDSALVLGALAFAGAGGCNNLVQSNWIRDQRLRHGTVHPPHRLARHRRGGGPTGDRQYDTSGRGKLEALEGLVEGGQPGATRLLLVHLPGLDHRVLAARVFYGGRRHHRRRAEPRVHQG